MKSEEPSIFTRIINRELPAEIVFETENIIVIKSIDPKAPVHLLAITKKPYHSLHEMSAQGNANDVWELFSSIHTITEQIGIAKNGYRLITNIGADAGQEVPHLHVHILGGEKLSA
jgi:histidine triad (HIT) family protein